MAGMFAMGVGDQESHVDPFRGQCKQRGCTVFSDEQRAAIGQNAAVKKFKFT